MNNRKRRLLDDIMAGAECTESEARKALRLRRWRWAKRGMRSALMMRNDPSEAIDLISLAREIKETNGR